MKKCGFCLGMDKAPRARFSRHETQSAWQCTHYQGVSSRAGALFEERLDMAETVIFFFNCQVVYARGESSLFDNFGSFNCELKGHVFTRCQITCISVIIAVINIHYFTQVTNVCHG